MDQITPTTEKVINSMFQRMAEQDADGIAEHFAEDIDWFVPGNVALPWVGPRSHRRDVADYFRTMWPHFEPGKSTTTIDKIVVAGGDAVVLAHFMHIPVSTGRTMQSPMAMHLEVADGKIVKMHLYEDTWVVSKAFFG
jgi:hypothetical protein